MVKAILATSAAVLAAVLAVVLAAMPAGAQTVVVPAPTTNAVTAPAPAPQVVVPGPSATTVPATTVPEKAMPYPVSPGTAVVEPRRSPVATDPRHPPVSAVAGGPAPADPREYATNTPITVTGGISGVTHRNDVTSFRLQTPTEAWTVVVPPGQAGKFASGRRVTVVGYPHVEIRNQLLAQSVTAGR